MIEKNELKYIIEAILLAANKALSVNDLLNILQDESGSIDKELVQKAIDELITDYEERGISLLKLASGFQFMTKSKWSSYVSRLWEEKPPKYSRALLETLAIIAYKQPVTRGEIEEVRGVAVSSNIIKTLDEEREWVKVIGHKDVPGRPALYVTTKKFLDYFGLYSLEDLPSIAKVLADSEDKVENLSEQKLEQQTDISPVSDKVPAVEYAISVEIPEVAEESYGHRKANKDNIEHQNHNHIKGILDKHFDDNEHE